ncbi:MAG: RluA family pseudouridine synthase [Ruminococcaceae bacterium]|nr:RluA family pseudouridine synthase [Oscillospiraceae bacterium]
MELKHISKEGGRLSKVLREEMGMSMGLMNKLKWDERLLVNGEPCHTDYLVQPGDTVTALLPDPAPQYPAEEGSLTVLYEDEYLLAVDKPAGMLIHPSRACNTGTLANFVLGYYRKTNQSCAFHPVTRLDRDTFGVVLLAKNAHIHTLMMEKLRENAMKKTYFALVYGVPPEAGVIDAPIARREPPSLLRYVSDSGKPCRTEFIRLDCKCEYSLLELHPITGRTHQLRVHCAHIGHPILGDPQYGNEESLALSREMGICTQALCAGKLAFSHPITGEKMELFTNSQTYGCIQSIGTVL